MRHRLYSDISAVGELRPEVSFNNTMLQLETGEFRPDNILAVGELRLIAYVPIHYIIYL